MPGTPLGDFDLIEPIGAGGMAEVWLAVHRPHGARVAVKVMAEHARDPAAASAFREEVRAVARLDHPGVVLVLDCGEVSAADAARSSGRLTHGTPFLAMELLAGKTLGDRAATLGWSGVAAVITSLLEALAHAHARGVLHRDIKPSNVLFAGRGSRRPGLRLTDFGLARAIAGERLDAAGALEEDEDGADLAGSPHYMAPEALMGRVEEEGPWTDLYSVGCLAFELVCGRRPFEGEVTQLVYSQLHAAPAPFEPRFAVPEGLARWIAVLLAKDPRRRPPSAAAALYGLATLGTPAVGRPRLPTAWRMAERSVGRSRRLVGAGLGLFGFRRPKLVGREQERDALWAALRRTVESGTGVAVLLSGEAGVGKSRLASWIAEQAVEHLGAGRWTLSPSEPTAAADLPALARAVLGCAHLEGAALRSRLGVHEDLLPEDLPGVCALLLPEGLQPGGVRLARVGERVGVVGRVLRRRGPGVLVIDDLHRGGDGAALFEHLVRVSPTSVGPLLVIGTLRPEELEGTPEVDRLGGLGERFESVVVPPLPPRAVEAMAIDLASLDAATAGLVARRSAGNPLFAVALMRAWVEGGALRRAAGGFRLSDAAIPAIPDDVAAVWRARLRRLRDPSNGDEHLRTLEVGAALGQRVDAFEWSDACRGLGLHADPDLIDLLAERGMVRSTDTGWAFGPDMLRRSLRRFAEKAGRWVEVQRACARTLRRRLSPDDPATARRLGVLEFRGQEYDRAAVDLAEATSHAEARSDYREALGLATLWMRALDALGVSPPDPRRADAHLVAARSLLGLGRLDDAEVHAREAMAGATPLRSAVARGALAEVCRLRGRVEEAMALLHEALDLCPSTAASERAALLHLLASLHRRRGEPASARGLLTEASRLAEIAGDEGRGLELRLASALVAETEGRYADATEGFSRLLSAFKRSGDRVRQATCYGGLGSVAYARGRWPEAEHHFRSAWALGRSTGLPFGPLAGLDVALVLIRRARFDALPDVLAELGPSMSERTHRPWMALLACYRLPAAVVVNDAAAWDAAMAGANETIDVLTGSAEDPALASLAGAELALKAGWGGRAVDAFELAATLFVRLGAAGRGRAEEARRRAREVRGVAPPPGP